MSTFDLKKFAISSVGAIALSATCVLAATGPVHANVPLTPSDWQQAVSNRVSSNTDTASARVRPGKVAETVLALRFDAAGAYAGAAVDRSSGDVVIDRQAVRIADRTAYPPLPAGYRGQPQTVLLRLAVGGEEEVARHFASAGTTSLASLRSHAGDIRIAAK